MNLNARTYVAGHRGMVGSAILRALQARGAANLITRTRAECDLTDRAKVEALFSETRPEYVYSHKWNVGDVLIWDERATLHRGRPWDYDKPRVLRSICCSVTEADGLKSVRII